MTNPNALVFARHLLPYSQTFVREQVRALRKWHFVLVGETRLQEGLPLDGIEVRTLRDGLIPPLERFARSVHALARTPDAQLLALLRSEPAELLHIHFGTDAASIWPTVRELDLPVLVTLHGYDINCHAWWWSIGRGGIEHLRYPHELRLMALDPRVRFIAVSRAIRSRAIEFGLPPDRITVRFIGVDVTRLKPGSLPLADRPKRILFVGRQVAKKGCEDLIRAFAQLRRRIPDAELVVIGDGPLLSRHRRLAGKLAVPVRFLGARPPHEVLAELHQARVFCLPSRTATSGDAEGLPISILEAQACGVPVVITPSGGAIEGIQEGKTGFCAWDATARGIAQYLERLLLEDQLLTTMGCAAREFVEARFDLARCTAGLEQVYADSVNTHER